ncbi:MAG: dihydrodipicolinate synthase family protein [Ruminiclostridium sp.]|nr:dihydrodipicolinate synthase family protein [Ruminiclostridium sp.]
MEKMLKGVVLPIPTPLDENEDIDVKGLARLIDYVISNGVDGIFILGTMGEFASISESQKINLVKHTVNEVRGRVKVFCNVGDCGTRRTIENANYLKDFDIDCYVVLLPFYFAQRTQDENRIYLETLINSVDKPVIFYENPVMTGRELNYEEFEWLKNQKNCVGIKDSTGKIEKIQKLVGICSERNDFGVLTGAGELAPECMKAGGDGFVPGLGSVIPGICADLYKMGLVEKWEECEKLRDKYIKVRRIYKDNMNLWPGAQKTALKLMGIMDDYVTSPHKRLNEEERDYVKQILLDEGII